MARWKECHHPILKLRQYLTHRGIWNEKEETALVDSVETDIKVGEDCDEKDFEEEEVNSKCRRRRLCSCILSK